MMATEPSNTRESSTMPQARRTRLRLACAVLVACTACTNQPPVSGPSSEAPSSGQGANTQREVDLEGAGDPYYPKDGNGGYDVTGYRVSISYEPASRRLDGDTTVTAKATVGLDRFHLDLIGFTVSSVEVDGKPARFDRAGEHELRITPADRLADGVTFTTRVRYTGVPERSEAGSLGDNGWQVSASGGAFAAGQPHSATYWFPANDTPKDKATFTLTARVPNGWSVVSNGREKPPVTSGGWTTYTWEEPNRIATYLTTVGVDKWSIQRSTLPDGIPVVSAFAPGAEGKKHIEARLPEVIEFLEQKFGPYPQSAAGGIYLNEGIGFSLETQGRPIYAQWAELGVVVHEMAHQWFGDSVTVQSWADICVNECFASYAQWLWDEAKAGADLDDRYRREVSGTSSGFWRGKLYDMGAGEEFDAVYEKGPVALHALRRQIGEQAFDQVLKDWNTRYRDANASWPDFERLVGEVSGQDLRGFFDAWFRGTEQPADEYLYPGSLRR